MRYIFLLIISIVFAPTTLLAFPINDVKEMSLPNGLKIIVREDHRAPIVVSSIWYKVGASYENNGKTGVSHMLEHMMFKGSEKYPPGAFNQLMDEHGAVSNAITTDDYTVYYEMISAHELPLCFQLEADRMNHLLFNDALFQKEKQVVAEERRMRIDNDPQSVTWERFKAAAFINSPYHHPTIGWMTDIQHYVLNDIREWYYGWYAPNNAVIVVVGDVNAKNVFELAKQYFDPIKSGVMPTVKPRDEISSLGEKEIQVNTPAKLPWVVMGFQVPTLATDSDKKEIYALVLCAQILGGGESSRFSQNLIRKGKIALSASAEYDHNDLHQTLFVLTGTPTEQSTPSLLKTALLNQVEQLKTQLVDWRELNRAKAQIIANKTYQQDSLLKEAFDLGVPEVVGLSWQESARFVNNIREVTPSEIRDVAKKYFVKNDLTVGVLKPRYEL